MKFAVVDLETTGLNPLLDRIIEIGIIFIDGDSEISKYSQLIHPGQPVPAAISSLTGITSKMISGSPAFNDVASQLNVMTEGYILVGHNVLFDYSFLKNAMRKAGISYSRRTICTTDLSRLFFPNKKLHSLKALCRNFNIHNPQPHRALSDATVTAAAFREMKNRFGEDFITYLLKRKKLHLTASVEKINNKIKDLPNSTGVYYFIGKDEKPLYIGKANRIRNRIQSHFRGEGNSVQLLSVIPFIKDIRFFETGSETLAALQEDHEIRHYWPKFNRAQKVFNKRFGIVIYRDMGMRWRMGITSHGKSHIFKVFFHQYHLAGSYVKQKVETWLLNGKYCGIGSLENVSMSDDEHNRNFENMMTISGNKKFMELFYTPGRIESEKGFILMEDGIYKGFGFIDVSSEITPELINEKLLLRYSSVTVENIVKKLSRNSQIINLNIPTLEPV